MGALAGTPVVRSTVGLHFLSKAGFHLFATNYQVQPIGEPVRGREGTVVAAVVVPADREVRWYTAEGQTLVFAYDRGEWTTWTGLECAGAVAAGDYAVLATADGRWLVESDTAYSDGGVGFSAKVRTAWLHRGQLMDFIKARKFALLGDRFGAGVQLRFAVYYNDRSDPEDTWTWDVDTDLVSDAWGDETWGAGIWGDTSADLLPGEPLGDDVLECQRRLARQKCGRLSIMWWDNSPRNRGVGFSSIALELGKYPELNRTPTRTY